MTLTKKHFDKIAEILNKNLRTEALGKVDYTGFEMGLIQELTDYFKTENPNFNTAKFKEACLK